MAAGAREPSRPGRTRDVTAAEMDDARMGRAHRFGAVAGGDVLATASVLIVDDYEANVLALKAVMSNAVTPYNVDLRARPTR